MIDQMVARLTRMARFDHSVYREIATDDDATLEAVLIVIVTAFLSAIGAGIAGRSFLSFILTLFFRVPLAWLIWSASVYLIGTQLLGGQGTFMGMLRVLGYTTAPQILGILVVIPCLGWIAGLAAWVLSLVLAFFAIRETLELTTEKTILTILLGWVISLVIGFVLP